MAHEAYAPVGYDYRADHYCLDCIPAFAAGGESRLACYMQDDGCNCTECVLDRIADDRDIDRYDESSYDMDTFPKAIPYHNDLHSECGPEGYGYGKDDPEWEKQYCNDACANCGTPIDGTDHYDGQEYEYVCPAWLNRKENEFK